MNYHRWCSFFLGTFLLVVAGLASAETPPSAPPTPPPTAPPPRPGTSAEPDLPPATENVVPSTTKPAYKDPTQPSRRVSDVLGTQAAAGVKVSPLALRGRVIAKDRPPLALLEVDGKMYSISKGSTVPGPNNSVLKVLDVTSNEVRLEISSNKEVIVLR